MTQGKWWSWYAYQDDDAHVMHVNDATITLGCYNHRPLLELLSLHRLVPNAPPPLASSSSSPSSTSASPCSDEIFSLRWALPGHSIARRSARDLTGALRDACVPVSSLSGLFFPRYCAHFFRRSFQSRIRSLIHALPVCGGRHHRGSAAGPPLPVSSSLCSSIGRVMGWNRVARVRRAWWCPWFRPRGLVGYS